MCVCRAGQPEASAAAQQETQVTGCRASCAWACVLSLSINMSLCVYNLPSSVVYLLYMCVFTFLISRSFYRRIKYPNSMFSFSVEESPMRGPGEPPPDVASPFGRYVGLLSVLVLNVQSIYYCSLSWIRWPSFFQLSPLFFFTSSFFF